MLVDLREDLKRARCALLLEFVHGAPLFESADAFAGDDAAATADAAAASSSSSSSAIAAAASSAAASQPSPTRCERAMRQLGRMLVFDLALYNEVTSERVAAFAS